MHVRLHQLCHQQRKQEQVELLKTEVSKVSQIWFGIALVFYTSNVEANNCGCNSGEKPKTEGPDNLDTMPYDVATAEVPAEPSSTFSPEVSSSSRREDYQKPKEQQPALAKPAPQDVQESTEQKEEPPNDVEAGSSELVGLYTWRYPVSSTNILRCFHRLNPFVFFARLMSRSAM